MQQKEPPIFLTAPFCMEVFMLFGLVLRGLLRLLIELTALPLEHRGLSVETLRGLFDSGLRVLRVSGGRLFVYVLRGGVLVYDFYSSKMFFKLLSSESHVNFYVRSYTGGVLEQP